MALARLTLVLLLVTLVVSATAAAADAGPAAGWMRPGPSSCGAMVEECLGEYRLRRRLNYDEEEEEEEDEGGDGGDYPTQTQYISYAALMRDSGAVLRAGGASYYNCQPGADANPYSRGCSAITQCRG